MNEPEAAMQPEAAPNLTQYGHTFINHYACETPPRPPTIMEHVVGQMYHHYDVPFNPANVACGLRDSVYILSEWRADVEREDRTRCLRKDSKGRVHDIIKFHFIDSWFSCLLQVDFC